VQYASVFLGDVCCYKVAHVKTYPICIMHDLQTSVDDIELRHCLYSDMTVPVPSMDREGGRC